MDWMDRDQLGATRAGIVSQNCGGRRGWHHHKDSSAPGVHWALVHAMVISQPERKEKLVLTVVLKSWQLVGPIWDATRARP